MKAKTILSTLILSLIMDMPNYGMLMDTKDLFRDITTRYNIVVRCNLGPDFFPQFWNNEPIAVKASEITESQVKRFPAILLKALSKYPDDLIQNNLKGIYLTKDLHLFKVRHGGFAFNNTIYIAAGGSESGVMDYEIILRVHHEITHLLMANYSFPISEWFETSTGGMKYRYPQEGGVKAIMEGNCSPEGTEDLYKNGFVNQYASSHYKEDFSEFSAYALTYPLMMGSKRSAHLLPILLRYLIEPNPSNYSVESFPYLSGGRQVHGFRLSQYSTIPSPKLRKPPAHSHRGPLTADS